MSETSLISLSDIDILVQDFLDQYDKGLRTLHRINYSIHDELSFLSFITELTEELTNGCITFVNNNDNLDGLNSYLFYIANSFAKRNSSRKIKKSTEYLCPGCLALHKSNLIQLTGNVFRCDECNASFLSATSNKDKNYFDTFRFHNKSGYKCPECSRFIPHPLRGDGINIVCPYYDCLFIGEASSLKKMHHPSSRVIPEKLYADFDTIQSVDSRSSLIKLQEKEDLISKIKILNEVIESQIVSAPYSGSDFTLVHKLSTYKAFKSILSKYPEDMVDYLLHKSRSGGFQSKIFQEYVKFLEESLPFCYKKGKDIYRVDSLLNENINIFDGISVFDSVVNDKLEIKNNTKEFYIGGRKAVYTQPYYIGKLLNVIDKTTKKSLISNVSDYSFSKIRIKDIKPGTEVNVTHLRIPPHYQMGGMVYINRIRKRIVEKSLSILSKQR